MRKPAQLVKPPVKIAHVYLNEIPPNLIHEITVVMSSALMYSCAN